MDTVYFIVPVFNVVNYLKRCVDSIKAQTYKNTYTFLVDDGSQDTSGKLCDEYAKGSDNIEVIHKANGGLSDARNAGIERALTLGDKDDYLVFLDSDDFVRNDFVEKLVEISNNHHCEITQCAYEKGDCDDFERNSKAQIRVEALDKKEALLGYKLKTQATNKLYRLYLFQTERFPVGRINEDEFLIYRLAYICKKIAFTNEKLYYYFQREGSIMSNIAKNLKNNPRKNDWFYAYLERIKFFEQKNEHDQVLRTYEKICTDIILRFTEQMRLDKSDRDRSMTRGEYIQVYRRFFSLMIRRKGMPVKRSLLYVTFFVFPYSACVAEKLTELRK